MGAEIQRINTLIQSHYLYHLVDECVVSLKIRFCSIFMHWLLSFKLPLTQIIASLEPYTLYVINLVTCYFTEISEWHSDYMYFSYLWSWANFLGITSFTSTYYLSCW